MRINVDIVALYSMIILIFFQLHRISVALDVLAGL